MAPCDDFYKNFLTRNQDHEFLFYKKSIYKRIYLQIFIIVIITTSLVLAGKFPGSLKMKNMIPWPFVSRMISLTHGAYFWNDLIAYFSWFISRNRDASVSAAFSGSFAFNCAKNFGSVPLTQEITTSMGSWYGLQLFFWAYGGFKSNGTSGILVTLTLIYIFPLIRSSIFAFLYSEQNFQASKLNGHQE